MRGSTDSKRSDAGIPAPQPMGIALVLLALVSCAAGAWRRELLLTLMGAIPLAVSAYCFLAALCLSPFYRKRAETLHVRMFPLELTPGEGGTARCSRDNAASWIRPPGIIIRYRLELHTADGRRLPLTFDPEYRKKRPQSVVEPDAVFPFPAPKRGAYSGEADGLFIMDILGLFQVRFTVPQSRGERLLVLPAASGEPLSPVLYAGGNERRQEPRFQRTDDLTGHRPYVPGDDPRRINWKLYGHAGGLFIREGEPEPPPHSHLTLLLDTEVDTRLYGAAGQGRRGVDSLCEQALALVQEYTSRGMDMLVGCTGGGIYGGGIAELTAALARPAAIFLPAVTDFPEPPENRSVLILALPRDRGETALDRFLKKQGGKLEIAVLFLYEARAGDNGLDEVAGSAARYYNRRGVHARGIRVS